jgi:hypothetical protein
MYSVVFGSLGTQIIVSIWTSVSFPPIQEKEKV